MWRGQHGFHVILRVSGKHGLAQRRVDKSGPPASPGDGTDDLAAFGLGHNHDFPIVQDPEIGRLAGKIAQPAQMRQGRCDQRLALPEGGTDREGLPTHRPQLPATVILDEAPLLQCCQQAVHGGER
ncbi:MAG: hypothetical protein ABS75_29380 [Pelagibacterium sp. SCN 63-23]|nr:MAG: hypothetical protein ABS75_29380 [Pelagibacterium sp. SCN 63-23]